MLTLKAEDTLDPSENVAITRLVQPAHGRGLGEHAHDFIELVYCAEGGGIQCVGGRDYPVSRGSLLFLNCGQSHSCRSDEGMVYYNFLLRPAFMSETLINTVDAFSLFALAAFSDFQDAISDPPPVVQFTGRDMLELEDIAERMEREFVRKEAGYRTIIYGYMTVIFSKIFRKMALPISGGEQAAGHAIAPELLAYIEEHCYEKITLSELASKCFYNPSYFSRVFKEYSGQSLTDFIHKKRIERALELLGATDDPIEQICSEVGYGDKKQFYRQFRQYTGLTPGEARRQTGQTVADAPHPAPAAPVCGDLMSCIGCGEKVSSSQLARRSEGHLFGGTAGSSKSPTKG